MPHVQWDLKHHLSAKKPQKAKYVHKIKYVHYVHILKTIIQ